MLSDNCLENKVILITGAGSGIGKAAAISYASHGAKVILLGKTLSKLEKTYDQIISKGYKDPSISLLDLSKADGNDYSDLKNNLVSNYNHLDGLLLNASVLGDRSPIEDYDISVWVQTLHINLTAQFILVQTLLPSLHLSNNASVVFTSSGVGKVGKAYWGAYAVSKFGIEGLTQILSNEHSNDKSIRFNCINPGAVATNMRKAAYPLENPKNLLKPEDIMERYLWLMSDESINVCGESLDCQ